MGSHDETSQPLLSRDNEHHDDSASDTASSTVYTPSTTESETTLLPADEHGLPEYRDVTPPYSAPPVGDYKADAAGLQVEQEDGDEDEETDEPVRRRRCCGRFRRTSRKDDKKRRLRRRLFVFLKIFLLALVVSFFIGKKCVRARKVGQIQQATLKLKLKLNLAAHASCLGQGLYVGRLPAGRVQPAEPRNRS